MDPIIQTILDIGMAGILLVLLIRGDLVPRPVLNREIERADKATHAASQNSGALSTVTDTMKEQKENLRRVDEKADRIEAKVDRVIERLLARNREAFDNEPS